MPSGVSGTPLRIGVDLGGTKIEILALDETGSGTAERFRKRIDTPRGDYDATIAAIAGLVEEAENELGRAAKVGIAMPGALSPATGLVKNANSTWLNGRPFDRDIEARLARPLRFANDANCFALSEAVDGAAAGADVVFGVILGTGCGGGLVVNGTPLRGGMAIAGEWGHNPLPWPDDTERPGPGCYCGRRGCIETWLSGPGLSADFARATGETLTAEEILDRAQNDPVAEWTLAAYEHRLAKALASVINIVDPDVIVLGGGLSNIDRLYTAVPRLWGAYVFSDEVTTSLRRNAHGDSSGVRGAAWLWPTEEGPDR